MLFALVCLPLGMPAACRGAGRSTQPAAQARALPPECRERLAEDFVPMANSERSAYYVGATIGTPGALITSLRAGSLQGMGLPREWGGGARGYALRFASVAGERIIGNGFEYGASWLLHEDNRYFASGRRGFASRLGYALASTVLARHDNGSRGPSLSALGGAASGAFISRAWQPRSTT